jgi:O-methyltransferase
MKNILRAVVPPRFRRIYKKYISPIVRDEYYSEYSYRRDFFKSAFNALAFNGIDGDYAEFGCCGGMTFGLAFKFSRRYHHSCKLWAFDSFCGLPPQSLPEDEHPAWVQGTMAIGVNEFRKICLENRIPKSDFRIVEGYYDKTLTKSKSKSLPANICLAYIDCDMYSSTKAVMEFLMPRLKHGMIIAFDDYYCWSAKQVSGERKACAEYFKKNKKWSLVPFVQFGAGGMSFIVESAGLKGSSGACY